MEREEELLSLFYFFGGEVRLSTKEEIKNKILQLQEMNRKYLAEISSIIQEKAHSSELQIVSYFSYSLSIAHEKDKENFCLGSFHIYNLSRKPFKNPYICLKLSASSPFEFSGKYLYKGSKQNMKFSNSWERFNDPDDKEEFWLRPQQVQQIEPFERLTFSDFQIKWSPKNAYSSSVLGYTYGDGLEDGIASLNHININGQMNEEDNDE